MDKQVTLKYGEQLLSFPIRDALSVEYIYENEMPVIENLEDAFARAIDSEAIGCRPLRELVAPNDLITVIISDQTRFWMRQDLICEMLLKYLENLGIADNHVIVVVALGTHRMQTEVELKKLASSYVYDRVKVVNHDCDASDLVYVGTTSRGTEVWVNPLAVDRKVITIGGTVHHLMAGYGGGRKSIVPGIASRKTIAQNHCRALDPNAPHTDSRVSSGFLTENPIHEDMEEAGGFVRPIFGINIVVNNESKHSGLFCGDFVEAWRQSCAFCQRYYGKQIEREADVVIASCNGYPKDINLYQAVKALLNGSHALKRGGTFIFLAECREGGGSKDFFDWIVPLNRGTLDADLRTAFTIGGYIFYASCEAIAKAGNFYMLSEIEPSVVSGMKIKAYREIDALLKQITFAGKSVYVIPNGGSVLPQMPDEYERLCSEFS